MPNFSCPQPRYNADVVTLAHGSGGKSMHEFINKMFAQLYKNDFAPDHDAAVFDVNGKLAFTTDSYVVKPLFFPGGDIGNLAVYGTINDLAMCGASPLYLSCSFIIEEGLPYEIIERICKSIAAAVQETGATIVTGDTKVVGRGQADKLYINTSGVGLVPSGIEIHPRQVNVGDKLIMSGDIGRHGVAVMAAREALAFSSDVISDCAPLSRTIQGLIEAGIIPKCLRDLTRGGLASALHEISVSAKVCLEIEERKIPVHASVRVTCEILGFDPIYIANEGRFLAIVSPEKAEAALELLHKAEITAAAAIIGTVIAGNNVELVGPYGSRRILPPMYGELLPRIC